MSCNFVQIHIVPYKSTQIRTDLHRFWQIHTYLFVWTRIQKYTHRINTMSCNFVKIHTDPYKSTQDSYRSTPIPTDQLRFEQINTYSFILQHIYKNTLILTQNHATSYRSLEIRSDTLRLVPIHKKSHIIKQIHKDMLRLTQSCYFAQIHTDPYRST